MIYGNHSVAFNCRYQPYYCHYILRVSGFYVSTYIFKLVFVFNMLSNKASVLNRLFETQRFVEGRADVAGPQNAPAAPRREEIVVGGGEGKGRLAVAGDRVESRGWEGRYVEVPAHTFTAISENFEKRQKMSNNSTVNSQNQVGKFHFERI